jgi:hypothetical protein
MKIMLDAYMYSDVSKLEFRKNGPTMSKSKKRLPVPAFYAPETLVVDR